MGLLQKLVFALVLVFFVQQKCAQGESSIAPTPTMSPESHGNLVEFYLLETTLVEWASLETNLKDTLAQAVTTYCDAYSVECNVEEQANVTFLANFTEVLNGYPMEDGTRLKVVLGVHIPEEDAISSPAWVPQNELVNILLGNVNNLQTAVGKTIIGIAIYTPPLPIISVPTPTPSISLAISATPTPTPIPPTHEPPTTQEQEENAVLVILSGATVHEWNSNGSFLQLSFKQTVAAQATDYCDTNPFACGIQTEDEPGRRRRQTLNSIIFTADDVLILQGYPKDVGGDMELAYALKIPDSASLLDDSAAALIPQTALLSISLEITPTLAQQTGTYIVGIGMYIPPSQPRSQDNNAVILGSTIPAGVLLLLFSGISVGIVAMFLRHKKAESMYDVHNYVSIEDPSSVELISHRHIPLEDLA